MFAFVSEFDVGNELLDDPAASEPNTPMLASPATISLRLMLNISDSSAFAFVSVFLSFIGHISIIFFATNPRITSPANSGSIPNTIPPLFHSQLI